MIMSRRRALAAGIATLAIGLGGLAVAFQPGQLQPQYRFVACWLTTYTRSLVSDRISVRLIQVPCAVILPPLTQGASVPGVPIRQMASMLASLIFFTCSRR